VEVVVVVVVVVEEEKEEVVLEVVVAELVGILYLVCRADQAHDSPCLSLEASIETRSCSAVLLA